LWNFVCKWLKGDATQGFTIDSDAKKYGDVDHGQQEAMGDSGVCKAWAVFLICISVILTSLQG
jgi:hypothetical protein